MKGLVNERGNIYAFMRTARPRRHSKALPDAVDTYGFSHDATISWVMDAMPGSVGYRGGVSQRVARRWMTQVSHNLWVAHKFDDLDAGSAGLPYLQRLLHTALGRSAMSGSELSSLEYAGPHPYANIAMAMERASGGFDLLSMGTCGVVSVTGSDAVPFRSRRTELDTLAEEVRLASSHTNDASLRRYQALCRDYVGAVSNLVNVDGGVWRARDAESALHAEVGSFDDATAVLVATDGALNYGMSKGFVRELMRTPLRDEWAISHFDIGGADDVTLVLHANGTLAAANEAEAEEESASEDRLALFDAVPPF